MTYTGESVIQRSSVVAACFDTDYLGDYTTEMQGRFVNKSGLIAAGDMSRDGTLTAAKKTAKLMRDEILLLAEEGVYLGSEEQLMERLKVS